MIKINNNLIIASLFLALVFGVISSPRDAKAQSRYYAQPQYGGYVTSLPAPTSHGQETKPAALTNPAPVITAISPSASPKGLGTKTVTITGTGFMPSSIARMNGFDRNTVFIDSAHLLMKLAEGDLYRDDPFFITVYNKGPGGGYSNAATFTITKAGSPASSVKKTSKPVASAGTTDQNIVSESPDTFYEIPETRSSDEEEISNLAASAIYGSNGFMPSGLIQWVMFAIVVLLIVILIRKVFGAEENYHAVPLKHS